MTCRNIVCGVDFSKESRAALRIAGALARRAQGRLIVLFVQNRLLSAAAAAARDARGSAQESRAALESLVRKALPGAARPRRVHAVATTGTPADEILKTARRNGADLIVIGTRGMGRLDKLLLGTTAEGVLRRSRIPVLAVPS